MANDPLDRALSQLNITGLQQSNNALYQVLSTLINQLKNINSNLIIDINDISGSAITQLNTDVVAVGPGNVVATITNQAVTFPKIQNITASRLLGRETSGAGSVEEITIGSGLTLTGTTLTAEGSVVNRVLASGETLTIPDHYDFVVVDYFSIEGTGELIIEGDGVIQVL